VCGHDGLVHERRKRREGLGLDALAQRINPRVQLI
jgi:hypothetical protein